VAYLQSLEKIITTSKKRKISSSICGQAPSDYPELVKMLARWGISSISVSPDVLNKTRKIVYEAEKSLLEEKSKKVSQKTKK